MVPNRVVLIMATAPGTGGKERVVETLADELARLAVQPLVVSLAGAGDGRTAGGAATVGLASRPGRDLGAVVRLAKVLANFRPDVLHVHDRTSLPYAALANQLSVRRPAVFTGHGLLLSDARPRLRERWAARGVRLFTAVCRQAADEYGRLYGLGQSAAVIPNGVPPAAPDPLARWAKRRELGLGDDAFVFLAVANVNVEKGYEDLLDAAAALAADQPPVGPSPVESPDRLGDQLEAASPPQPFGVGQDRSSAGGPAPSSCERGEWCVLAAGSLGNRPYADSVLARWRRLGLEGRVRFLGFRSDVAALRAAADAFVLASRKEALPMALLEAMAGGLPAVATAVGEVPFVLGDGEAGLLVPAGRPGRLADALRRVRGDAALARRLADAARRRVQAQFSAARMARRYVLAYRRALDPEARP